MFVAFGETVISVKLNEDYLQTEENHLLIDDVIYLEASSLVKALGGSVSWNEKLRIVKSEYEDDVIELQIENENVRINGEFVTLDHMPLVVNNKQWYQWQYLKITLA